MNEKAGKVFNIRKIYLSRNGEKLTGKPGKPGGIGPPGTPSCGGIGPNGLGADGFCK